MGRKEGLEKGIEKGIEKGVEKGKEEVAKNLLSLGISLDVVKKATQLPQTVIEKLAKVLQPSPAAKLSATA